MRHEAELVKDLMYEGCEPHWQCIHCGEAVPVHCYTKEEFEKRCCECHEIRCDNCSKIIFENAYHNCKIVADSIVDIESFQKADAGLVLQYIDKIVESLGKQIPKTPLIWNGIQTPESPLPDDDWRYECPCCGNQDIDPPDHHCICGQALDWSKYV